MCGRCVCLTSAVYLPYLGQMHVPYMCRTYGRSCGLCIADEGRCTRVGGIDCRPWPPVASQRPPAAYHRLSGAAGDRVRPGQLSSSEPPRQPEQWGAALFCRSCRPGVVVCCSAVASCGPPPCCLYKGCCMRLARAAAWAELRVRACDNARAARAGGPQRAQAPLRGVRRRRRRRRGKVVGHCEAGGGQDGEAERRRRHDLRRVRAAGRACASPQRPSRKVLREEAKVSRGWWWFVLDGQHVPSQCYGLQGVWQLQDVWQLSDCFALLCPPRGRRCHPAWACCQ